MKAFQIALEQYRGTSYEIGYRQGKQIDYALINMVSDIFSDEEIDIDEVNKIYSLCAPHLLDEVSGLADSMNISFDKAALFSGYGTPVIPGMGCSSVVNNHMLVRNYDFSPDVYDARFVFVQPSEGYASAGHSLHVMGRTEGVNEKGLTVALHFVNNKDTQSGLIASSVIRIVLDTCKNTDEAINMIKRLPHSWSFNFSIGDSEGNTVVVEESPFDIRVRENKDVLLCTNHFQNQDMSQFNRENLTGERLNYLRQSQLETKDNRDVFNMFRDVSTPLYNEEYLDYFGTLHTFAYLFDKGTILTAVPGSDVLEVDFKEWVNGKDIDQSELNGILNES